MHPTPRHPAAFAAGVRHLRRLRALFVTGSHRPAAGGRPAVIGWRVHRLGAMLTKTTTALLEGLVDPANQKMWLEFDQRYRPILVGLARRLGLSAEDAADAAQETLTRFLKSYRAGKYDRGRGRLGSWIIGIARHSIADLQRTKAARHEERGLSAVQELPDEAKLSVIWDAECEREILWQGLNQLRQDTKTDARTLQAFEMVAFAGRTPADVAQELGTTTNDVYLAKHRCLKRLRVIVERLNELYEVA